MPSIRIGTSLQSIVNYLEGISDKQRLAISSTLSYIFGIKDPVSVAMSSSVFYQFMTQWFKNVNYMSSTVDYLSISYANEYQLMTTELSWVLTINQ